MSKEKDVKPDGPSFEEAIAELEAIVEGIDSGNLSLEEMVCRFERGTTLIGECQALLKDAEQKIKVLEDGKLKDFRNVPQSDD